MKLEQLHFLKEAIKYGSISIAAEKNYITQPAFSTAITKLEKELNTTLLQRTRKGVKPTETCTAIMEKITVIFEAIDDIRLIAASQEHFGTVNISTLSCMCDKILSMVTIKISEENLPFTLSVDCTDHEQIFQNVLSGNSSFGFLFHTSKLDTPEIKYTDLFEDEFVAYVGPQSPFWNDTSISLESLLNHPYIAYKDEFLTEDTFSIILGGKPQVALRLNDVRFIKKLISEQNYISLFYKIMTYDDIYLKYNLIHALPISDCNTKSRFGYIESLKYKPSAYDKIFLSVLNEVIQKIL